MPIIPPKIQKSSSSESTGLTALIFGMWQWRLVVHYINCANHAPVVKFGHAPGSIVSIDLLRYYRKTMQVKLSRSQVSVYKTIGPLVLIFRLEWNYKQLT